MNTERLLLEACWTEIPPQNEDANFAEKEPKRTWLPASLNVSNGKNQRRTYEVTPSRL